MILDLDGAISFYFTPFFPFPFSRIVQLKIWERQSDVLQKTENNCDKNSPYGKIYYRPTLTILSYIITFALKRIFFYLLRYCGTLIVLMRAINNTHMKTNIRSVKLLFILSAFTFAISFTSCSKDDNPVIVSNTINDKIVSDASFTLLEKAVIKAGLTETLKGPGPFTVFAPDDAAFAASGITSATIDSFSAAQLKNILLYHTLAAKVLAANLPVGPNAKVETANIRADSVFVTKNAGGVFVNGIKVTTADIAADNGVMHKLEKVLIPAAATVVQTVITTNGGDNGLDSLAIAAMRADSASPGLIHILDSVTLTVFAPTNKAFRDLLSDLSLQNVSQIPINTLLPLLRYHVVRGRIFTSDFVNGSLQMSDNGNTIINLTNGTGGIATITGNGNGGLMSEIIITNIIASNGVIHLINRILIP